MGFNARSFSSPAKGRLGGVCLFLCALVFFAGTFLITRHADIFISPDETAAQFFTQTFSRTGSFRVLDPLNGWSNGILHPRSVVADGAYLLPGGFLGLPTIFSFFTFFFGIWILPFLAPMIAIFAAIAWGKLVEQWFSKRVAIVSSIVLLFHPAFWYYASRGLMPNVLFVSLLIFGAYFLRGDADTTPLSGSLPACRQAWPRRARKNAGKGRTTLRIFLAGLCFGFALFVRLAELYWVLPLVGFLFYVSTMRSPSPVAGEGRPFEALRSPQALEEREGSCFVELRRVSLRDLSLFILAFALPLALMLFLNLQTYGNPFMMGYTFVSSNHLSVVTSVQDETTADRLSWLMPFGFHPRAIFWHTLDYLFLLFWWLTIPTLCALPLLWNASPSSFQKREPEGGVAPDGGRSRRVFIIVAILIALWLCIWYGSWRLNDNPDPTQITIANSYVRYWLPVFVMSTPLIATTIVWISERLSAKRVVRNGTMIKDSKIGATVLLVALMTVVIGLNIRIVFFHGQDALMRVEQTLQDSKQIRAAVFDLTPSDAILVVDRADKLFFPYRHVLYPLRSETTYAAMPGLVDLAPLYYYGVTLPQTDLDYLNQKKFIEHGLRIEFVKSFGIESLYRIVKK